MLELFNTRSIPLQTKLIKLIITHFELRNIVHSLSVTTNSGRPSIITVAKKAEHPYHGMELRFLYFVP